MLFGLQTELNVDLLKYFLDCKRSLVVVEKSLHTEGLQKLCEARSASYTLLLTSNSLLYALLIVSVVLLEAAGFFEAGLL